MQGTEPRDGAVRRSSTWAYNVPGQVLYIFDCIIVVVVVVEVVVIAMALTAWVIGTHQDWVSDRKAETERKLLKRDKWNMLNQLVFYSAKLSIEHLDYREAAQIYMCMYMYI